MSAMSIPTPDKSFALPDKPLLATIVVGNYNYERFLAAAIDSALEQSYAPLEVIVVDDGSTDGSRNIIAGYENRIRAIYQKNGGQGAAYNAGWLAARGAFVLFLDSDDVLEREAMRKVVDAFMHSDAVKVQFYLRQVDRELKPLGYLLPSYDFPRMPPREQIAAYGYYVSPPASGNAYRKSFLDEIMPIADEELYRQATDGYTTGLAGMAGKIATIAEVLGLYRVHGDNYGGEGGVKSVQQLHHMFMRDIKRELSQHAFDNHFNFHFPEDRSRYCPGHTKLRLLSLRMLPREHPIKTDRVGNLLRCGLVSAVRFPHLKPHQRLVVAMGFLALGLMPRWVLRRHFAAIVSPQHRNKNPSASSLFDVTDAPATFENHPHDR
jgi:glycosyltransferase involved in cell wall biosynthesis